MAAPKQTSSARRKPHGLSDNVVWRSLSDLKEFSGNPRQHPEAQITALMKSIRRFWTNPILVDEAGTILAGHGRWEAAKRLGMTKVPTVMVSGLSDSDKRAVVIADNRLPEQAVWDFDLLREHFQDLIQLDFCDGRHFAKNRDAVRSVCVLHCNAIRLLCDDRPLGTQT